MDHLGFHPNHPFSPAVVLKVCAGCPIRSISPQLTHPVIFYFIQVSHQEEIHTKFLKDSTQHLITLEDIFVVVIYKLRASTRLIIAC